VQPRIDEAGRVEHISALVGDRHGRVLIVADPAQVGKVPRWIKEFDDREVFVIAAQAAVEWELGAPDRRLLAAATLAEVDEAVRPLGRVDAVVSLLPPPSPEGPVFDQLDLFRHLFPLVGAGGMYVVDRKTATAPDDVPGLAALTKLFLAAEDGQLDPTLHFGDGDLLTAIGGVLLSGDLLVATKQVDHYLKLRDAEVDRLLPLREPDVRVTALQTLPAGTLLPRSTERSHGVEQTMYPPLPAELAYPEMHLRHVAGRIASSGQLLGYTDTTILPDSFRWHLADRPGNIRLVSTTPEFARLKKKRFRPKRELPGNYYKLDCIHSEHFGHLMTEVVSRFWGWEAAKQAIPDLKVLFHVRPSIERPKIELQLLAAYGIDESDVVWVDEPVWLESVVTATPLWHNHPPYYAHPAVVDTWTRMGDRLLAQAGDVTTYERIFISRGGDLGRRRCRNQPELEDYFSRHGFQIIYPERHPMPEQAAIFANARVVAGFAGSAMFNLMYARKLESTIVLTHDAYHARNEELYAALLGGRIDYFRSHADLEHPEGGFDRDALRSSWAFDFERFGADLDRVVAES
jgi:capsular polysaccharide biosynthesis protein